MTWFVTGYIKLLRSIKNCFVSNVEPYAFMKRTCLGNFWHIFCVCFNNGFPVLSWAFSTLGQMNVFGFYLFQQRVVPFYRFDSFFVNRKCVDLLGKGRCSSILHGSLDSSNNGLPRSIGSINGLPRSIISWVWNRLVRLEAWIVVQLVFLIVNHLLNPILFSSHVSGSSLVEAELTQILSRKWLLQFPS